MPNYEYKCEHCGHYQTNFGKHTDIVSCEKCKETTTKIFSVPTTIWKTTGRTNKLGR